MACRKYLARAVSRIVPPQDIEDIVQETYVRVCQYSSGKVVDHPRALLVTVARNLALDHVKRADHRLTSRYGGESDLELLLARHATDESFDAVATDEEFARFCDAVRQLPVPCRRVFVLKKVYGYSQREIAGKLGLSENVVEKHIAAGMLHCVRQLAETSQSAEGASGPAGLGSAELRGRR